MKILFLFLISICYSMSAVSSYKIVIDRKFNIPEAVEQPSSKEDVINLSPKAWFTSEDVTVNGSNTVLQMEDVSGNGNNATQLYGELKLLNNQINGFSSLETIGDSMVSPVDLSNTSAVTIAMVVSGSVIGFSNYNASEDGNSVGGFLVFNDAVQGRPGGDYGTGNYIRTGDSNPSGYVVSTGVVKDYEAIHYINGQLSGTALTNGTYRALYSGAAILGRPFLLKNSSNDISSGYGAEIIIFDKELNSEDLNTVNEYLMLKYGL